MSDPKADVPLTRTPLAALQDNAEAALRDDAYPFPGAPLGIRPDFALKLLAVVEAAREFLHPTPHTHLGANGEVCGWSNSESYSARRRRLVAALEALGE
jgi:hypothetical protein